MSKQALKSYYSKDFKGLKKIMIEEEKLDKNGDLPSGKIIDDLIDHIWSIFWKIYQDDRKEKLLKKKQKKKMTSIMILLMITLKIMA